MLSNKEVTLCSVLSFDAVRTCKRYNSVPSQILTAVNKCLHEILVQNFVMSSLCLLNLHGKTKNTHKTFRQCSEFIKIFTRVCRLLSVLFSVLTVLRDPLYCHSVI